jgi:translation initiation factor 2B subunit (eIF-2B alpha/beta/delta family)
MELSWLQEILADHDRGASEIEGRLLSRLVEQVEADPDRLTRSFLEEVSRAILTAFPAMANLLQLVNSMWLIWERLRSRRERRYLLVEEWRMRLSRADTAVSRVADFLRQTLAGRQRVFTLSRSGTVVETLSQLAREGTELEVVVGEGRPRREGCQSAALLARAGLRAWLVVDGALPALLHPASGVPRPWAEEAEPAVVLGADSVGRSFVNKVGSYALALAAREAEVPVFLVASDSKLLPPALERFLTMPVADPKELAAPAGVEALNAYFERVPLELVSSGVTESGIYTARELSARAQSLEVSAFLERAALDGGNRA